MRMKVLKQDSLLVFSGESESRNSLGTRLPVYQRNWEKLKGNLQGMNNKKTNETRNDINKTTNLFYTSLSFALCPDSSVTTPP